MHTIVTRVPAADLAAELAAMRKWLDKTDYEPAKFTYDRYGDTVGVCLEFDKEAHAEAFRSRFDGQKRRRPGDELLLKDYRWVFDFRGSGFGASDRTETMARACRCRLMAEEVRAEADGFGSSSAKATMRIVAQTWDRMAEDRAVARPNRWHYVKKPVAGQVRLAEKVSSHHAGGSGSD